MTTLAKETFGYAAVGQKVPASGLELDVAMRHPACHSLSAPDHFMKKFAITVHGQNFFIQDEHDKTPRLREFYVHAFLEAESVQEAEGTALELVRDLPKLKKVVMNPPDNQPTLSIDESAELSDWPECTRPLSGFVFIEK